MKYKLPRGVEVDTDCIPDDFDESIERAFADYTSGTNSEYVHADKLGFIDLCVKYMRRRKDGEDAVADLVKARFAFEFDEYGTFCDKSDFLSIAFMTHCYESGVEDAELNSGKYADSFKANDNAKRLLCRIISVVMAFDGEKRSADALRDNQQA